MNVSFAIQAHPARQSHAETLADAIGGEVDIVYDPSPSDPPGPWRSFRRLLEESPRQASHRLQIQDDALVCPHFRAAVELAVAARPDQVLVFFVGINYYYQGQVIIDACLADESWAVLPVGYWLPCVSTCWPMEIAADAVAFGSRREWRHCSDDDLLGRYIQETGQRVLASVPSLVEHPGTIESLIGANRWAPYQRAAACWIGDCQECSDAREIDWTLGPR